MRQPKFSTLLMNPCVVLRYSYTPYLSKPIDTRFGPTGFIQWYFDSKKCLFDSFIDPVSCIDPIVRANLHKSKKNIEFQTNEWTSIFSANPLFQRSSYRYFYHAQLWPYSLRQVLFLTVSHNQGWTKLERKIVKNGGQMGATTFYGDM